MKKMMISGGLVSILIASIVFFLAGKSDPVQSSSRSYFAEGYNVDIVIQPDNQMLITETLVFTFEGGPYTYAFRELGLSELDSLEIISATMDGFEIPFGDQANQVEFSDQGNAYRITWHFPETSDATRLFTVTYQVSGGIRREGNADLLLWQAIPGEHEYNIQSSIISVRFPSGITPYSDYGFVQRDASTIDMQDGTLYLIANDIAANDPVSLRLAFPAGDLITQEPVWQQNQAARSQVFQDSLPSAGMAAFLVLIAGIVTCFFIGKKFPSVEDSIFGSSIITTPPQDIPPVLGSLLLNNLTSSYPSLTASMISLGQRGWINIEYIKGGFLKSHKFIIRELVNTNAILLPHERWIMDLIREKSDEDGSMELRKLFEIVQKHWNDYNAANIQDAITMGWVNEDLKIFRQRVNLAGVILILISTIGAGLLIIPSSTITPTGLGLVLILVGAAIGLGISGLILSIYAQTRNILTQSGFSAYQRIKNFRKYLLETMKLDAFLDPSQLDIMLPYATAFGFANKWISSLMKNNIDIHPLWLLSKETDAMEAMSSLHAFIQTSTGYGDAGGSGAAGAGGGGGSSGAG
jgi:uncharacterized membrane protein YgcG